MEDYDRGERALPFNVRQLSLTQGQGEENELGR
jgi:hypothetical protein